ncbi:YbgC/FadM family acyl-CoA thioesterase [Tsuneonella sp. HG222]
MTECPPPASGTIDGKRFLFPLRVYFEDTDVMGIVYYPNYLKWFERARWEMLRAVGVDLKGSQEAGQGGYAVAALDIRYHRSAKLDDSIVVESRVSEIRAGSVLVAQTALRDGEPIASANLHVVFIGPDGRPRRQPREWIAAFEPFLSKDPA